MKKPVYKEYYENEETKNLSMGIYAYGPPRDGMVQVDGFKYYSGIDNRTVENYKIYKDAGMNILFSQTSGVYGSNEIWKDSQLKMVMDRAQEAGIKQIIILDEVIRQLSASQESIIGEGKKFSCEEELDAFITERMKDYRNHPCFRGIQLVDEPKYTMFKAIGQVYRSVKRVCPTAFIQCNLASMFFSFSDGRYPPYGDDYDFNGRYKAYLEMFVDETGADYIMTDRYPFHAGDSTGMYPYYIRNLQICNEVCRERNIKLYFIAQSFGMRENGVPAHRMPNEAEMALQIHMLLAFGIKELAYFVYWSRSNFNINHEYSPNGEAMVTMDGKPTPTYYHVRKLNGMVQKLAPVIMNFEHVADTYAVKSPFVSKPMHLRFTLRGKLKNVERVETDQEVVFMSELHDSKRDKYLYVLHNITCPKFGADLPRLQKSTAYFKEGYTKVAVFQNNEWHTEDLVDGAYTTELANGDAVYLMPY